MNTCRMDWKLSAALLLALLGGMAFAATAAVAEVPPGFGGQGGTLTIVVPHGTPKLAGHVYDDSGPIANAPVQYWQGETLVASTVTDASGDFAFSPPGFGGQGGSLAIGLGDPSGLGESSTPRAMVGGMIARGKGKQAIAGAPVEWWLDETLIDSTKTDDAGGYVLAPPGSGE